MADTAALENSKKIQTLRQSPASPLRAAFEAGSVAGTVELREVPFLTMAGLRVDPGSDAGERLGTLTGGLPSASGEVRGSGGTAVLWLGPAEFLLVAPAESHESLGGELPRDAGRGAGGRRRPGGGSLRQPHHARTLRPAGPGRPGEGLLPGPAPPRLQGRDGAVHGNRRHPRRPVEDRGGGATGSSRGHPLRSSSAAGSSTPCANTRPPRSPDGAQRPGSVLCWHRAVLLPHGRPDAGGQTVRRRTQKRRAAELHHQGAGRTVRLPRRHRPGPRFGQGRGPGPPGPGPGDGGHRHRGRPGGRCRPRRRTPDRRGPPGGLQLGRGRGAAPPQVPPGPPERHDLPGAGPHRRCPQRTELLFDWGRLRR